MKIKSYGKALFSVIIISLFILPTFIQAAKQTIRVVVENASIRLKPEMESDIIENPPVGSVFSVEKKVGEWYEIRFPSTVGILITGYIHEMLVEVEKETPKPKRVVTPQPRREPIRPAPPPRMPLKPKQAMTFNIGLGGLFHLIQAGYDYEYTFIAYEEQAKISDSLENASGIGFDLGLGFFAIPSVEITAGINYVSKSLAGTYGFDLPNMFIWNDIAHSEATADAKFTAMIFNFGFNFHFMTEGSVRPYAGGGISYVNAKMDLVEDMMYRETFYSDWSHTIEITEVQFTEESISKLGFNIKVGANFAISDNIFIFGEGRYIIAKKEIPHPLTSQVFEDEVIDIDLGGASFILGVKLGF